MTNFRSPEKNGLQSHEIWPHDHFVYRDRKICLFLNKSRKKKIEKYLFIFLLEQQRTKLSQTECLKNWSCNGLAVAQVFSDTFGYFDHDSS